MTFYFLRKEMACGESPHDGYGYFPGRDEINHVIIVKDVPRLSYLQILRDPN